MDDPLKKYIAENREEFDHLEPSADVFFRIREELHATPPQRKAEIRSLFSGKWMAAASVLLVATLLGWWTLSDKNQVPAERQLVKKGQVPQATDRIIVKPASETPEPAVPALETERKFTRIPRLGRVKTTNRAVPYLTTAFRDLADSTSASVRLAAILQIRRSGRCDTTIMQRLAATVSNDANSNVRLAALELMGQYVDNHYVSGLFVQSLIAQSDPLVQLEMVGLLSQTNDKKLDEKLYALASNPETVSAVKEQAYLVLLNQNKLY